jgi:hypothetical protein
MKRAIPYTFLFALFFLFSCGGGGEEYTETEAPEEAEETEMEESAPADDQISTLHVAMFTTPDFDSWRQQYKENTNDENLLGIFENADEPGMYMIAERNGGNAAQREFFESARFDSIISATGTVVSRIIYLNSRSGSDAGEGIPFRMAVGHEVKDYDAWAEKFMADADNRKAAGLTDIALSTEDGNPNMVHVWFGVDDMDKAKEMLESEGLKKSMEEAGVMGEPEVSWWKPTESAS